MLRWICCGFRFGVFWCGVICRFVVFCVVDLWVLLVDWWADCLCLVWVVSLLSGALGVWRGFGFECSWLV